MSFISQTGLPSLLKEGARHFSGVEETILKNIEAGFKLAQITRTSMGPNGRNKMVINHLDKLFVTNDAATIVKELEVAHPAAKMIVLASQMQEQEVGDGTNFTIVFAGELLKSAEGLIRMGLHPSDVVSGFTKASKEVLKYLDELEALKVEDLRDMAEVSKVLTTAIGSKQYLYQEMLAPFIARACIQILPKNPKNFNVDNVRVVKILGGGVMDTTVVKGFVLNRDAEGTIKHVTNAKVAVFAGGLDVGKPETKANVIFNTAKELKDYNAGEEKLMEDLVRGISEAGVKVVVSGSAVGEIAMHYIEKYHMMLVKCQSKFQLRRICKATGATALVRTGPPTPEELGFCDVVGVQEMGSTKVTIFRQDAEESAISTLVVRGSTDNLMDDIERAVEDGVNVFKAMTKDARFVAGAGATEIELARRLAEFADTCPGLDQYAIKKYAESLEIFPRTLAENAGGDANEIVSSLYALHQSGKKHEGVNIEGGGCLNAVTANILDLLATKYWGLKLASDAAVTVLNVDQIIMAKPAGGPKPKQPKGQDFEEDM